ncbi:extracellular calcium-sensing receptor-like [Ambystoma mexicanum]|uniref:extracellular calcium-sensing receptor-like n=1 Tax=Ambystoma mexicanum TaxID=8296 RepID=UPI0037E822BA
MKQLHSQFYIERYQCVLAMAFATDEINKDPKVLPNVTLGFRIYDTCFSDLAATEGAMHHLSNRRESAPNYSCNSEQKMAAIIGDSPSSASVAIARILGVSRFPQISFGSGLSTLSDKRQFPSFLRTAVKDYQPEVIVQILLMFGWTWVGLFASDTEYGTQGSQKIREEADRYGICLEFSETLSAGASKKRIGHAVNRIRTSSAKVVVLYVYPAEISPVLEELSQQNITGKVWVAIAGWFSSLVFSRREFWKTLAGTVGIASYSGAIPGFKDFLYAIHPSKYPGDIYMKLFWEHAFGCQWKDTLNQSKVSGSELVRASKPPCTGKEQLESLDAALYDVHTFRFSYKAYMAVHALAQGLHDMLSCQIEKGPYNNRACADSQHFLPWQVLHYIKNVHFKNTAGQEMFFDANGDSPVAFDILNWQLNADGSSGFVKVGRYDAAAPQEEMLLINVSRILWGEGSTQVPISVCSKPCPAGYRKSSLLGQPSCCFDCIPCSEGQISNKTGSSDCIICPDDQWSNEKRDRCIPKVIEFLVYEDPIGTTLSALSLLFSLVTALTLAVFYIHRHTPVVKANNTALSYLLLSSLTLCFLCALIFIGKPTELTCMLRHVLFGIIFAVCLSCLLAKTTTVTIAFRATQPSSILRRWMGSRTAYSIVLVSSFIQVLLGLIWVSLAPSFPEVHSQAMYGTTIMECNEGSAAMFFAMMAVLGILASMTFVAAFLARKLPDSFNEAKYITFSMLIFITVWLSFVPAYLSTKGKYMVAVEIFAILSSSLGLLSCIFVPKCYIIILRPNMNTKEYLTTTTKSIQKY